MSNDENLTESVEEANSNEEVIEQASERVEEVIDSASESGKNLLAQVMELKESNPKVFFGAIGGVVVILLALMMMGGGNKKSLPTHVAANLAIGQTYQLQGVNSLDPTATIRLVSVPGSIAAYDDTEDDERNGACKHMLQGTKVKAVQMQEAFGGARFVEVEMLEGDCQGRKGWVISNNLK